MEGSEPDVVGLFPAHLHRPRHVRDADEVVGQITDYAIISLDPQGVIESWNLGAALLKGYTAEEAIGCTFAMFYTDEDRLAGLPLELLTAALEEGRVEHEGWRVRKDGTRFWGDVIITALHDDQEHHTGFTKVTRDLTKQHHLEVALRASEERLRLLVGQVVDYAIIALDPQGTIETWNLGAERLKGYSAEEVIGRSFAVFYSDADRHAGLPADLLRQARENGRVEHSGWRLRRDGSRFWGDVVITALRDRDGRLTGYAKVTRDRTDLKTLEDAQDAFYAAFSHDFRTPITALKGFVDAVRYATDDAQREHVIQRAEQNADKLLAMVEGLVEFAQQRVPNVSLLMDDIDVAQVARSVAQDLPLALNPARVRVCPDAVALTHANGVAIHRVLTNLVVNALKYSPADTEVRLDFDDSVAGRVRVVVSDRGRGIAEEDLVSIFDEFQRGRLAENDGGSGLGLASVRRLVQEHHGEVAIESVEGEGTSVILDLPAAGSQASPIPPQPGSSLDQRSPVGLSAGPA